MSQSRPWITCHVLETTSGKPASGIKVHLSLIAPATSSSGSSSGSGSNSNSTAVFEATTNADGRVTSWEAANDPEGAYTTSLDDAISSAKANLQPGQENLVWSLRFDTGSFYGEGKTFWPQVELRFFTKVTEEHYHVPLLLGPWSYTTYRGS